MTSDTELDTPDKMTFSVKNIPILEGQENYEVFVKVANTPTRGYSATILILKLLKALPLAAAVAETHEQYGTVNNSKLVVSYAPVFANLDKTIQKRTSQSKR